MLTASDLFALSQGGQNRGPDRCHWCGSACERFLAHDDMPYAPFAHHKEPAKVPGGAYLCTGCWMWRRKRVTVNHLSGGGFTDGQCAVKHSWLITGRGSWILRKPHDYPSLYDFLIHPDCAFVLTIIDEKTNGSMHAPSNLIQTAYANDLSVINLDTPLFFTYNGVPFSYAIYELKEAILDGDATGKQSGIQLLFNIWKPPAPTPASGYSVRGEALYRGRGRPPKTEKDDEDGRITKRPVFRSGMVGDLSSLAIVS